MGKRVFLLACMMAAGLGMVVSTAGPARALPPSGTGAGAAPAKSPATLASPVAVAGEAGAHDSDITAGAKSFIDKMAHRALGFLADSGMTQDQKRREFGKLLQDSFDMDTIGRFTLGRYWRVSTKQQRDEYLRLFKVMVVNVYSSRFKEYTGQRFEVRGARQDGDKDAVVSSFLIPQEGPEIQIDWRVRRKDGRYKVVDVLVEGVSMSVTQRSDFAAVIQRGGGDVQVLISYLKQQ